MEPSNLEPDLNELIAIALVKNRELGEKIIKLINENKNITIFEVLAVLGFTSAIVSGGLNKEEEAKSLINRTIDLSKTINWKKYESTEPS